MMNVRALAVALAAVLFAPVAAPAAGAAGQPRLEKVVLAGGCFWGMEAVFEHLRGVRSAVVGYSGGSKLTAHYEIVSTGATGHAESVELTFDPAQISYAKILQVYFTVAHDPTELDRQGPDAGHQYRSEIYYTTDEQKKIAETTIRDLEARHVFPAPIVTKVEALRAFYPAEEYHQHYADLHPDNPYIVEVDEPKLVALREKFPQLLKH
jgi:peptide-methionine (S)-S-oxide reductase